ncbi:hypothetical protein [Aequorivita marina]|uniref:hypothetical protein n=1 Tax=Aequorivita marina TaxID=3073654 RepID=UPI0028762135|nr:hypothetical protein [Aequorivita sp. S2608]MDS1298742.1 hypothetical protein [Aequorivita sp. S2608]
MKNVKTKILLLILIALVISCSTQKGLIKREKTEFGTVKFYVQTDLNNDNYVETELNGEKPNKRIVIKVADSVYYSFYSDEIGKRTKKSKNSVYRLFYGEIPKELDAQIAYQKLSKLDSLILSKSDKILDSLKWNDFKRWNGATAFNEIVIYYHGFPKNGKFEPF